MKQENAMPDVARRYILLVIAAGFLVLAGNLKLWPASNPMPLLICLAGAAILAPLKLRLPATAGSYSPGFLPVLYGLAHLTLPETLMVGCVNALSQCYLNTQRRPTATQVAFNVSNLTLSIGVCALAMQASRALGIDPSLPAVAALIAGLYFTLNTGLVSGVLSLLQAKPLLGLCSNWYLWSFPYYLTGAAAMGIVASPERAGWEASLVVISLLGLIHFYCALSDSKFSPGDGQANAGPILPPAARVYLGLVIGSALLLLALGMPEVRDADLPRLAAWLALTVAASTCKVRLPGLEGTVSVNFVLLLSAIVELPLGEVVVLAVAAGAAQCLWRPARRPSAVQVAFNAAGLAVACVIAHTVVRVMLEPVLSVSLAGTLAASTGLLYCSNTLIVTLMLCLASGQPLSILWRRCHFWVFPYYLVGAAAAGLLVTTSREGGLAPAMLVAPTMVLIWISYRLHMQGAVDRKPIAAAAS